MYLHLGRDVAVNGEDILAVCDMDTATWSRYTRAWLAAAEKAGKVFVITDELPKSAVVVSEGGDTVIYISQISSKTLLKRAEAGEDAFSGL
jgi:hypothetical protein